MLPLWLGALIFLVVAAHEFGHYFAAAKTGQMPLLPFFIPLIYGVLGGTTVKGKDPNHLQSVALAGSIVSIIVMFISIAIKFTPMAWASFWMLLFQVWSGTFGADGRRYRRHKDESSNWQTQVTAFQAAPVPV